MFYSHEILTSRKGGLATVWLVATLGSRTNLKKINRKAILDVNVPRTCDIIIHPEAPMALRLQGNLLYGVSRVYSQQHGYILSDAQVLQSNMRALLKVVRTSELDPNAGKARPDQLMIEDDPAFLPDFALDIDISALDLSTDDSSRLSSGLSAHSQHSSHSSRQDDDGSMLGLIIPTSDTGGAVEIGGFRLPSEQASSAQRNERLGRLLQDDAEAFELDPGFSFDAGGNLIEEPIGGNADRPSPGRPRSESATSTRVRQELEEGMRRGQYDQGNMDWGFDMPRFNDEGAILPDAEPFPAMVPRNQAPEDHDYSGIAEAPLRRGPPKPRALPNDERQELRNADLASWKEDYLANMFEATRTRQHHQAPFIAKKNASFFVMGGGIGGIGAGIGSANMKSPLDVFSGDTMMEMLTGVKLSADRKRGRGADDTADSDSEARRSRLCRDDGEQMGRGDDQMLPDDDTILIAGGEGIEIGRHAPSSLVDEPTYPWNNTASALASRHGSSLARGHAGGFASSVGGVPTSAAGPSSLPGIGTGTLDRRASRVTSASPLVGRGRERYSSLEIPVGEGEDLLSAQDPGSNDILHPFNDNDGYDSFWIHGPAAGVSTQTATQSQWLKSTLDKEARNFLDFMNAEIAARSALPESQRTSGFSDDEEEDELNLPVGAVPRRRILFERLLPPEQHSTIVAAQALHHVLALATRSLVDVKQHGSFGQIELSLVIPI